jgi:hypothetical protein
MSADSGCPCPDIRWQEPHAPSIGPATTRGGTGCWSGNQSGGFLLSATAAASYSLVLPGTRTIPVIGSMGGCTGSGMLKAHAGRPSGIVTGADGLCAAAVAAAKNAQISKILSERTTALGRVAGANPRVHINMRFPPSMGRPVAATSNSGSGSAFHPGKTYYATSSCRTSPAMRCSGAGSRTGGDVQAGQQQIFRILMADRVGVSGAQRGGRVSIAEKDRVASGGLAGPCHLL